MAELQAIDEADETVPPVEYVVLDHVSWSYHHEEWSEWDYA